MARRLRHIALKTLITWPRSSFVVSQKLLDQYETLAVVAGLSSTPRRVGMTVEGCPIHGPRYVVLAESHPSFRPLVVGSLTTGRLRRSSDQAWRRLQCRADHRCRERTTTQYEVEATRNHMRTLQNALVFPPQETVNMAERIPVTIRTICTWPPRTYWIDPAWYRRWHETTTRPDERNKSRRPWINVEGCPTHGPQYAIIEVPQTWLASTYITNDLVNGTMHILGSKAWMLLPCTECNIVTVDAYEILRTRDRYTQPVEFRELVTFLDTEDST